MGETLSSNPLAGLIAEAEVLAGGEHRCVTFGHKWKFIGGRACPFSEDGCGASQGVHECEVCGDSPKEPVYSLLCPRCGGHLHTCPCGRKQ